MATSLADQLKRLAVPQTTALVQSKKKDSLLFDPKEAANLDRQTVYEIGLDGLQDLKKLNPRFEDFERTLFHVTSKDFQRSMHPKSINKKVDEEIQKFLMFLSPYFLLKCAQKCLEWLINRYEIHRYNVDQILMLILPYHETKTFARVLQLIDLKEPTNRWHWLHPLQKPGVPLSKSAMLNHCVQNVAFLAFVCNMPVIAMKKCGDDAAALNTLYAYCCTTVVGALEYAPRVSDVQVTEIIKLVAKGLVSQFLEFAGACVMITAQLARSTKLRTDILLHLVNTISKVPHEKLQMERCILLVLLYQSQAENLKSVPYKALTRLATLPKFVTSLSEVEAQGGYIVPIVVALLEESLKLIRKQADDQEILKEFATALISSVKLDKDGAVHVIRIVINTYIVDESSEDSDADDSDCEEDDDMQVDADDDLNEELQEWFSGYLQSLEKKYANVFDRITKHMLETTEGDKRKKKLLDLLGFAPRVTRQIAGIDVFEKLNHPNDTLRAEGVKYLLANYERLQEQDNELLLSSMRNRLQDDSYRVVNSVLECPPSLLASLVGEEFFVEQMIKISTTLWYKPNVSSNFKNKVVGHLCSEVAFGAKETDVLFAALLYLLPRKVEDVQFAMRALKSEFGKKNKLFLAIRKDLSEVTSKTDPDFLCSIVFRKLTDYEYIPNIHTLNETIQQTVLFQKEAVYKFLGIIMMTTAVMNESNVDAVWQVLNLTLEYYKSTKVSKELKAVSLLMNGTLPTCMTIVSQKQLPLQGLFFCLMGLARHVAVPSDVAPQRWWHISTMDKDFKKTAPLLFIRLFHVIIVGCMDEENVQVRQGYINILKHLLQGSFKDLPAQLGFLSNVWVSHELGQVHKEVSGYELQLRSLLLARALLMQTEEPIGWTLDFCTESIIPPLLIALSCPASPVRIAAVECFLVISKSFAGSLKERGYATLVGNLLEFQEEIKVDPDQISVVLYKLLSPDPAVKILVKSSDSDKLTKVTEALFDCIMKKKTPVHISSALLKILAHVNSKNILKRLTGLGKDILGYAANNNNHLDYYRSVMFINILSRIVPDTFDCLENDDDIWEFFKSTLSNYKSCLYDLEGRLTQMPIIAMGQLSKACYEALPHRQQTILKMLVKLATESDSVEVVSAVGHVMKRISLDSKHVVAELIKMRDSKCEVSICRQGRTLRTRTISTVTSPPELLKTTAWREGNTLLEFIQNKKKLRSTHLLLPVLFDILKRCLDFEEQAPIEYTKQLVLTAILHCCQKLSQQDADSEQFILEKSLKVELVVQCIRASQNPQTHHHALLVLSHIAGLIPEQVLHNIMAIFTFMGSCVLRQDDTYSFQIIEKIVDTIIPLLVKACQPGVERRHVYDPVASVLRVFVDALLDVPEHRRMPLYYKLMVTLGAEDFLWLLMALVIESQACQSKPQSQDRKDEPLPKKLDFMIEIAVRFPPHVVLSNCVRLLEYLRVLPIEKDQKEKWNAKKLGVNKLFDVGHRTKPQFHHFKYAIVVYLVELLGNSGFINEIAELSVDSAKELEPIYATLIENVLQYVQVVSHMNEMHSGKPPGKYWKCTLMQSYELLDRVNGLLLSDMFLKVVLRLLDNPILTVRRKAMELTNARIQDKEFFSSCKHEDLIDLLPPLLAIINNVKGEESPLEQQLNEQTAFTTVKLLARVLADERKEVFIEILAKVAVLIKSKLPKGNVLASAVLCCAELCSCLREFSISSLPSCMPAFIKILHKERKTENPDIVLLAIVSGIYKVVESLPHFLSPYLHKLLLEVCLASSSFVEETESQKVAPIVQKLKLTRQKISSEISLRILTPCVSRCHLELLEKQEYKAVGPLMDVLADSFTSLSSTEFSSLQTEILDFFLSALEFRSDNSKGGVLQEDVNCVEGHVIRALVALVLKLSESSFRPLYYNLYHWATAFETHNERLITFYRLSHGIAESLKSLFVLFAGHIIKNAGSLLEQTNLSKTSTLVYGSDEEAEDMNLTLLEFVLKTLHSIFLYDSAHFLNKERFDALMQPLVDQLENTMGGTDALRERATALLTPCIVQFAVVAADDSLWKQLNYQILLKTRHALPVVRLAALQTVCEMTRKLGEDFLPQMPETVPFLAELMEDEEEEVEKTCIKVVQEMEEILGEPIRKYF